MKKYLLLALLFGGAVLSAAENLVTFGSFSENDLAKWALNSRQKPFKPYSIQNGVLVGQSVDKIPHKNYIALSRQIGALEANGVYEFGGKVKLNAAPGKDKFFRLALREANDKGKTIRYCNIEPLLTSNGEWLEIRSTIKVHPRAKSHQIYVIICNFLPGEKVEVDDIFVCKSEAVPAANGNLVKNGDFEAGTSMWNSAADPTSRSTSIAFDSKRGKVLRLTGDIANRRNKLKTMFQELPVLKKGRNYTFSFAYKANISAGNKRCARVVVREIRDKVRTVRYIGNPITGTSDWKTFERKFTPASNASGAMLLITCENLGDEDVLWVDDIKVIAD